MGKNKNKKKGINLKEIINPAAQRGVGEIIRHHPRFRNIGNYIARHINPSLIKERAKRLYAHAKESGIPREEMEDYITEGIANYIASGAAFDRTGKEVILKKSLEEKAESGFFKGFFARRQLKGEKYLDKALGAFGEVYEMFKSGDYNMPEVEKPLEYLNRLGFAAPAADILRDAGLIGMLQYSKIKREITRGAKKATKEFGSQLERYSTYSAYKTAAAILGISGTILIAISGTGITGNAIGNSSASAPPLIAGIIILVFALILLWRSFKN